MTFMIALALKPPPLGSAAKAWTATSELLPCSVYVPLSNTSGHGLPMVAWASTCARVAGMASNKRVVSTSSSHRQVPPVISIVQPEAQPAGTVGNSPSSQSTRK